MSVEKKMFTTSASKLTDLILVALDPTRTVAPVGRYYNYIRSKIRSPLQYVLSNSRDKSKLCASGNSN